MNGTVWATQANQYLVPKGSENGVVAKCGHSSVPLLEWQHKYQQDVGATIGQLPSTTTLVKLAEDILRVDR